MKYGEKWRRDRDSNPGKALTFAGFQDPHMIGGKTITH